MITEARAVEMGERAGMADARMPVDLVAASRWSIGLSDASPDLRGVSISELNEPAVRVRAAWRVGYMLAHERRYPLPPVRCNCCPPR